ncbi:hypothetical protein OG911_28210 [Streptomyces sp. NBC_00208]|uniref:hypothetical protein n=1 Tax=Streptomyces sp. NBC_00208 TaxID=2975681 RepID=UPI002E2E41CE|nr:hypothetical protein [Streptomyces sp. NBC_00208]
MTEVPRVRVTSEDLHGEAPVALRDSRTAYELAIDFSHPPERIAEALTEVIQEGVDSRRWTRRGTGEHQAADQEETTVRAAPHPEGRY